MSRYWIWTYRYNDNDELAILVAKKAFESTHPDVMHSDVTRLIREHEAELVDVGRGFRSVGNFESTEWDTWLAFELCPAIEIYSLDVKDDVCGTPNCRAQKCRTRIYDALRWKILKP